LTRRSTLSLAGSVLLTGLTIGPGLTQLRVADEYLIRVDSQWQPILNAAHWLRDQAINIDSVFVADETLAYFLAGLTGLKTVAVQAGHMNPSADARGRLRDLGQMLATTNEGVFTQLASRYGASYVVVPYDPVTQKRIATLYPTWSGLDLLYRGDRFGVIYGVKRPLPDLK
jgi:hypothetical protein